jgi:GntR family transcriptional repressor for pyruvate dehydrogenase complex
MPIQTIETRRLYRQIAEQLRLLIENGEYARGSRLPPERDLAAQLGVSRPSVREALIALEIEGLVEVRMGSGVYVLATEAAQALQVRGEGPLETIRARQLIESELAAHAATHMKKTQIAGLRDALALMRREMGSGHAPTRGDRLFHVRIAEASDNSVLVRILGSLFDERENPLAEQLGHHFESPSSWGQAMLEHEAVIEAIASRSAEAARRAMDTHLSNSHDRFTASISQAVAATPTRRKIPARRAA